jgi:hypothetical protein
MAKIKLKRKNNLKTNYFLFLRALITKIRNTAENDIPNAVRAIVVGN